MFMSYVLALEFIPKGLRSEYEPRKDVGVSELDMTGHLGLGNSTAAQPIPTREMHRIWRSEARCFFSVSLR